MPRLVSSRPSALVTWIELGGYCRLAFGVAPWDEVWCLALMVQPPPSPPLMRYEGTLIPVDIAYVQSALLRVQVPFATGTEGQEGMTRVAAAANASQTLDICLKRTTEALTLFRNLPRVRADDVRPAAERLEALVTIGWDVRDWMLAGAAEKKTWALEESMLVGMP